MRVKPVKITKARNSDIISQAMLKADITTPPFVRSKVIETRRKMPLVRRRRPLMKLSSSPVTTVDAQGTAFLCFPEDHSWFQGNISTDDESNYSLYGERISVSNNEEVKEKADGASADKSMMNGKSIQEDDNNNITADNTGNTNNDINQEESRSEDESESEYYRVTMIDHFSGQHYILPKIFSKTQESSTNGVGHLFTSQHGEVTFRVDNVYKGQKADLMIQRFLACPSLVGKKCMLYSGEINILFNDAGETGRSWCL